MLHAWFLAGTYSVSVQVTDAQLASDIASAQVSIQPGELDHIVLSPATATILSGQVQAYTAEAFDPYDTSLGDVTALTTFGILCLL